MSKSVSRRQSEDIYEPLSQILWTHYCVSRMKLGKKQKEQDYSDAEIERSQRLVEEVLGPEEIAKLKETSLLSGS